MEIVHPDPTAAKSVCLYAREIVPPSNVFGGHIQAKDVAAKISSNPSLSDNRIIAQAITQKEG